MDRRRPEAGEAATAMAAEDVDRVLPTLLLERDRDDPPLPAVGSEVVELVMALPMGAAIVDREGTVGAANEQFWSTCRAINLAVPFTNLLDACAGQRTLATRLVVDGFHNLHVASGDEVLLPIPAGPGLLLGCEVRLRLLSSGRVLMTIAEVSGRRTRDTRMVREAMYDPRTGLATADLVLDRLAHALGRSGRSGSSVAVLAIDLNSTDSPGGRGRRAVTDATLRDAGDRLVAALRTTDTIGRLGDEVVIICEDPRPNRRLEQLADRLLKVLGRPHEGDAFDSRQPRIGLAHARRGDSPSGLLARAQRGLDAARASSSSICQAVPSSADEAAETFRLIDLRQEIANGAVHAHVQPIVDLATHRVVAGEALLRWWRSPVSTTEACEFLALVERCGMLEALDAGTLRELTTMMSTLDRDGRRVERVWFNVTQRDLVDPSFPTRVAATLERSQLTGDRLGVDIGAAALAGDQPTAFEHLRQLRALGVAVALDDVFATPATWHWLPDVPFDHVKLERSLIQSVDTDPVQRSVLRGLIESLRALDLTVVAKGVERWEQAFVLRDLGAHHAQGLLFGSAMPLAQLAELAEHDPPPCIYLG